MDGGARRGIRWGSVALGWLVATVAGALIGLLASLYGPVNESPAEGVDMSASVVVASLVSGFLAYLLGGFVAGRSAGYSGGLNGAMTAVFGLVVALVVGAVLAVFGAAFVEDVAMTSANSGLLRGALLTGALVFLVNLFGGYVGGKLGEPTRPDIRHFG